MELNSPQFMFKIARIGLINYTLSVLNIQWYKKAEVHFYPITYYTVWEKLIIYSHWRNISWKQFSIIRPGTKFVHFTKFFSFKKIDCKSNLYSHTVKQTHSKYFKGGYLLASDQPLRFFRGQIEGRTRL